MYKYYDKNKYKVMEYDFSSITEFLDYLDTTPTNTTIWGCRTLASNDDDYEFCKTKSLNEAEELCRYGWHENYDRIIELKTKLEKYIKLSLKKNKQFNYYIGYTPDVKAYLEGNPLSMFNKINPTRKHIDIYYNAAIRAYISPEKIFNRGVITLCLVEILENMGFSVGLNIFTMSECHRQIHYAKFNLKRSEEKLNIQKLFFPLCNPSFLRRLVFRLREETPDISSFWIDGYGKTCDDYLIRRIINLKENDIVICQPNEMGVNGHDIIDDANNMFDYISRFNNDELELKHIKKLEKKL